MRLSTIKLAGFKSFVEPTKIPFPDQMTCVVGPNGCGKSNVIDAVRWVLGESSAKNLRGDAMTDVIFNGSTNRKPISQASVELIFDNTQGHLPGTFADRNQIAIKRLVTRDAQSLYFLNGSKCRKRDITDIFLGTGLGPRSYAIIEQGMISRLIESKPQELRVFIEEAAGVSKYKERRRETQTRIKSTRENLERLLDVRKELQTQLDKLAVQSNEAKNYRALKAQERTLKGQIAVLKWQKLDQQQKDKTSSLGKLNDKVDFYKQAHVGHDDVLASLESNVQLQQQKVTDAQQALHQIHTDLTKAEQQQINLKQQQLTAQQGLIKQQQLQQQSRELQSVQQQHRDELDEALEQALEYNIICTEQVSQITEQVTLAQEQKEQSAVQWQQLSDEFHLLKGKCDKTQSKLTQLQQSLQYNDTQLTQVAADIDELTNQPISRQLQEQQQLMQSLTQRLASQQTALNKQQAQTKLEATSLKTCQQTTEQTTQQLNEVKAQIAGLTSIIDSHQPMQSGNLLAQLVVKDDHEHIVEQALQGLEHLTISEQDDYNCVWEANVKAPKGSVATLVSKGVYPQLLTKISYQENFKRTDKSFENWLAVIDKNGHVYGANWHKSSNASSQNSILKTHKQLKQNTLLAEQLSVKLAQAQQAFNYQQKVYQLHIEQTEEYKQTVHQLAQQIASAGTRRDMLSEQQIQLQSQSDKLNLKQQQLTDEREVLIQNITKEANAVDALTTKAHQAQLQIDAKKAQLNQNEEQFKQLNNQLAQYRTQQHQASLDEQKARSECQLSETKLSHAQSAQKSANEATEELAIQLEELVVPIEEVQERLNNLVEQRLQKVSDIDQLEEDLTAAKSTLTTKQEALKSSQSELDILQEKAQALALEEQRLILKAQSALEPLTELGQNLKTVLEALPESVNLMSLQATLSKTTQQLTALGAVNLAAIDEFEQAKVRSEYLDQQLDDLTKALTTLEGAIQKIDRETKSRFKTTFDQVNKDFSKLFPKVFGGGSAYLELTSDNLLESGVSIMARPPGKKNSTIHLLSGGEKALSALSLVFSIFRLNPAPFCMLDEVDAPLDDANVGRFCRLVEEMSQSVQFIYISHNKIAMEMGGRLTGVTMAEPGVSRMVAVDIEQAVQMAHA